MQRYTITLGATTTANGKVSSASHVDTIDGALVALDGDKCWCPTCNAEGLIVLDGPRLSDTFDGREVALSDDLCMCKCSPPPRLVATQDFVYQVVDGEQYAATADAALATAAGLNSADHRSAAPDGVPFVLLDPRTQEPYAHRPYRLSLADGVIEGVTGPGGATRPLTAAERAAIVAWQVEGEHPAA